MQYYWGPVFEIRPGLLRIVHLHEEGGNCCKYFVILPIQAVIKEFIRKFLCYFCAINLGYSGLPIFDLCD